MHRHDEDAFLHRDSGERHSVHHKITFTSAKSASQIARDITRRLLPDYLAAYQAATEAKRDADKVKPPTASWQLSYRRS